MKIFLALAPFLYATQVAAAPAVLKKRVDEDSNSLCTAGPVVTSTIYETATVSARSEAYSAPAGTTTPAGNSTFAASPSSSVPPTTSYYVPPSKSATSSAVASPSASSISGGNSSSGGSVTGYSNSLYFTNWGIYGADFQPQQIPAGKVTRILYSFADIGSDGTVKSSDTYADIEKHYPEDSWDSSGKNAYGCVKQMFELKKQNRHLKVLLSIGGWTYSPKFAPVAATAAGREKFASSAVALMADWGFDGIDIDWEYPTSSAEAESFVELLKACREELDSYAAKNAPGYHFLITIASPAGPKNYNVMDLAGMDPYVDAWNLMAYDYAGSWDSTSGHQANIYVDPDNSQATKYSTEKAVKDYVAKGISARKIMMGLPLYGRSFEDTPGLGKTYNGVGKGTIESGIWLYKDLPRAGAEESYDSVAKASYSYDASTQELISYDNIDSAKQKTSYMASKGLGGAVFWEASGDRNDSKSLVGAVASAFGGLDTSQNLLSYPASQYDNIKNGLSSS